MIQEEKELLLKDLCGRLLYGVMVERSGHFHKVLSINPTQDWCIEIDRGEYMPASYNLDDVKPYLRPLSSMAEEEKEEYCNLQAKFLCSSQYPVTDVYELFDWLDKNHFDYRGLIPKDLAIEVTKENNPYKD